MFIYHIHNGNNKSSINRIYHRQRPNPHCQMINSGYHLIKLNTLNKCDPYQSNTRDSKLDDSPYSDISQIYCLKTAQFRCKSGNFFEPSEIRVNNYKCLDN